MVYNLLSNALKYRHPDREPLVRVHSYFEGKYVVLEVQDNGLGMGTSAPNGHFLACFSATTPTSKAPARGFTW